MKKDLEIIDEWVYENGADAYDEERNILRKYNGFKYMGENILGTGNSELFTTDILGLDT